MDYKPNGLPEGGTYQVLEEQIKEHLKTVMPEYVYDQWINYFVIEKVTKKKIVIGYYGTRILKTFEKEYQSAVALHISSLLGSRKKLKIVKRKSRQPKDMPEKTPSASMKKNVKVLKLFIISMIFIAITLCVALVACNYIGNRNFKETFYSVSSLKVNQKIRIVQISDLHNSIYGENNERLISRVQKLNPDIIIYTGDCIDSNSANHSRIIHLCQSLAESAPSYYIYGNNEAEAFYDVPLSQEALDMKFGFSEENRDTAKLTNLTDALETELENVGVRVLKNESDTIVIGKTTVDICGILTANPSAFWSYAGDCFDAHIYNNENHLKITAMHEPLIFEEFSPESWGDLLLCGHTHGGTMKIPMVGPLYTHEGGLLPERKGAYIYGRYDVLGSPLIISSGLENKNVLRINNPPELVIIDVNKF